MKLYEQTVFSQQNLFEAVNATQSITELRAANQRPSILGNRVEMDIAKLVEANGTLLSVGIHLDFADARCRVAVHLEKNLDKGESPAIRTSTDPKIAFLTNINVP